METPRAKGYVAHWLPGTNPQTGDFARAHHLPPEVGAGGAKTLASPRNDFEQDFILCLLYTSRVAAILKS